MAETSNIRIITALGKLAYRNAEDLGIVFSRIVDDFTDLSNRFQDFSYDFELPFLKENSLVFGAPEAKGSVNFFNRNQSIECQVYLNDSLLLDGLINLESITYSGYKCKFFSKFKELIDAIDAPNADGSDKTLKDLQFPEIVNWSYELSMILHISTNYKNSDETFYQYPFSYYGTHFTQEGIYSGYTDSYTRPGESWGTTVDDTYQNFYYLFNQRNGRVNNRFYIHQIPPAVYLVSIVKQILADAGWKLGGQFFESDTMKKIIYLYAGDDDIYDQATGVESGSSALTLQIAKFLPDDSQSDFLKDVINMFNLYMKVDITNKVVSFETYNTLFGDKFNPYDITNKINISTLSMVYEQNNNPSIEFEKAQNQNVVGDNYLMSYSGNNSFTQDWEKTSNVNYYSFMNKKGTTDSIKLGFSEPNVKRSFIYNDSNISGINKDAEVNTIYLPCLTKQSPTDNANMKFNKASGDTYLYNDESTIKFAGKGSLMFYYGRPLNEFETKSGDGYLSTFMYVNVYVGALLNRVPINVVSPFQLQNYRTAINDWLGSINATNITSKINDRRTITATYLQTLWQMMGQDSQDLPDSVLTDFSLVFDDNGYFHNTLWSVFHKYKYDTYQNSNIVEAEMRMNANDWQEMQIERPIMFNNEIYSLVAIEGYNPIARTCSIRMIKKI